MLVERRDAEIELFACDDQWRRENEVRHLGEDRHAIGEHLRGDLIYQKRLAGYFSA
jgi:hypothetical protein